MLSNLHTHSTFCDGKSTPEEVVLSAIEKGFCSIGFSGHAHIDYEQNYCMRDTDGYMSEIKRLKDKYKDKIQIYLGIEEEAGWPVCREDFDYIIGSCHYFTKNKEYYPIDISVDGFKKCLELFGNDPVKLADSYYKTFCEYIDTRRPDIIGHFDLITKFDEVLGFPLLGNEEYNKLAERYIALAAEYDCFFEVNTGAISRGYRTSPYPAYNLLRVLKEKNAKIVISSDSHHADTISHSFDKVKTVLKEVGFEYTYLLFDGRFTKDYL